MVVQPSNNALALDRRLIVYELRINPNDEAPSVVISERTTSIAKYWRRTIEFESQRLNSQALREISMRLGSMLSVATGVMTTPPGAS